MWYNPEKISYKDLLTVFWKNHNPRGSRSVQYRCTVSVSRHRVALQGIRCELIRSFRSAIWYTNEEQRKVAEASKADLEQQGLKVITQPSFPCACLPGTLAVQIATKIEAATKWTDAEEYHQDYIKKSGSKWF